MILGFLGAGSKKKRSLSKLSKPPAGVPNGNCNHLSAVSKLHEYWLNGQNAVIIDDQPFFLPCGFFNIYNTLILLRFGFFNIFNSSLVDPTMIWVNNGDDVSFTDGS
ncbi:hypothetical protein LOK49_LG15G01243 [Camellia lanceoleosa]|uniref:Uncharacterized protein n=1 Tax=Camellia lanceoleosa TaxID=1840588 RepID=A0ACC0F5W6_9ERIC|nr:hypothetical protein LOK49_LG15G01243 [Camellia lanceoleosa]